MENLSFAPEASWLKVFQAQKKGLFARGSPGIGRGSPDLLAMTSLDGHLGPFPIKGTLTAEQRAEIRDATGCSAAIRERGQWGQRVLTLCGPCDKLQAAHKMALQKVELNGDDGGRAPEPRGPPPQRSWKKPWDGSWKYKDWPTKEEVQDLQQRLNAAEQQCANNAWRIQVLEGWYWWCNNNESGRPYAAQSSVPNPANSKGPAPRKGESKKAREASPPSDVTKSPGEFSEVSEAPTLVPEAVRGDGALNACAPIPEHAALKKKCRRKKKAEEETSDGRGGDRERTPWRPKQGRGNRSEER